MNIDICCKGKLIKALSYTYPSTPQPPNQSIDISNWSKVRYATRCYMKYNYNSFSFIPYAEYSNSKKVVILLESPHKDEFDDNFNPLIPLNGASGRKFDSNIINRMNIWFSGHIVENQIFEIILYNPVPYQTSLYHFLSNKISYQPLIGSPSVMPKIALDAKLRNEVWKALFNLPCCNRYFEYWLKKNKPDYIINCCTGIKGKNYLNFNIGIKYRRIQKSGNLKTIVRT